MKRYLIPFVRLTTSVYLIAGLATNAHADGGVPYECAKPKKHKKHKPVHCPTRHHHKVHCAPTHVDPCCGDAVCCFTGVYAGGQVGLGMTRSVNNYFVNPTGLSTRNPHSTQGVIGGLHLGYNYQCPMNVLLGLEIYGNLMHNKAKSLPGNGSVTRDRRYNNFGLAAKVGYVLQCTALYARIGVDSTKWGHSDTVDALNITARNVKRKVGVVPGIGIAHMITNHLIAALEGDWGYYKKSNNDISSAAFGNVTNNQFSNRSYDITFRLSYKW